MTTSIEKLDRTAHLGKFDNANRWYPISQISEYFDHLRSPSRAWPYSYLKATHSKKFAKWLKENHVSLYNSCS